MNRWLLGISMMAFGVGCTITNPMAKTNAEKCQGAGGVYQASASACSFRPPDVSTLLEKCNGIGGTYNTQANICQMKPEAK